MRKTLFVIAALLLFNVLGALIHQDSSAENKSHTKTEPVAVAVDQGNILTDVVESLDVPVANAAHQPSIEKPARLIIPSINLDVSIQHMGINEKGEMAVPNAENVVGWYKDGTRPGNSGSAVLAAHVYNAFNMLHALKNGADIYVVMENNERLHFVVADSMRAPLNTLSADKLFNEAGAKRLKLITCEGTFVKESGTYDHRRVVSAILVE